MWLTVVSFLFTEQFSIFVDFIVGLIEESNVHHGKKLTFKN